MIKKEFIIFDWDGTLCNSLPGIVRAMQAASVQSQLPMPSDSEVYGIVGLGLHEAATHLFPHIDQETANQLVEHYRVAYRGLDDAHIRLFPGVMDTLENLRAQGHTLAVATGKSRAGLDRVWEVLGMTSFFDASRCNDEARSKPAPDMVLQLMQERDFEAEQSLVVGDSVHDLGMARAAGVAGIGVSYGANSAAELSKYQPVAIIDSIGDLPGASSRL